MGVATLGIVASSVAPQGVPPPAGYIEIPGTAYNNLIQTPNDNPVIDDLSFTCRLRLNAVPGSGSRTIAERWLTQTVGVNRFIMRFDFSAKPMLIWAQAAASQTRTSTVAWPFAAMQWGWLRCSLDVNNGSGQHVVLFQTSLDGLTYTTLDTVTTGGVASVDAGAGYLAVGGRSGSALGLNGAISDLIITNASGKLFEMRAANNLAGVAVGAASFVVTSGHTVNVGRSGSPALVLVPPP